MPDSRSRSNERATENRGSRGRSPVQRPVTRQQGLGISLALMEDAQHLHGTPADGGLGWGAHTTANERPATDSAPVFPNGSDTAARIKQQFLDDLNATKLDVEGDSDQDDDDQMQIEPPKVPLPEGMPAWFSESLRIQSAVTNRDFKKIIKQQVGDKMKAVGKKFDVVGAKICEQSDQLYEVNRKVSASELSIRVLTDRLAAQDDRIKTLEQSKANAAPSEAGATSHASKPAGSHGYGGGGGAASSIGGHSDEVPFEERSKFIVGGWDSMPPQAILDQVKSIMEKSGLNLQLDYSKTSQPVSSIIWVRFKPSGFKNSLSVGWAFKKFIDGEPPILPVGAAGPAGPDSKIWCQPFRTDEQKAIRRMINTALRWAHGLREDLGLPREYQRGGFDAPTVGGDYRKNKVSAKWKMQVFAEMSTEPSTNHLVLVADNRLQQIFQPDVISAGKTWSTEYLDTLKASFLQAVRPR